LIQRRPKTYQLTNPKITKFNQVVVGGEGGLALFGTKNDNFLLFLKASFSLMFSYTKPGRLITLNCVTKVTPTKEENLPTETPTSSKYKLGRQTALPFSKRFSLSSIFLKVAIIFHFQRKLGPSNVGLTLLLYGYLVKFCSFPAISLLVWPAGQAGAGGN
jgi:hypothetical protein